MKTIHITLTEIEQSLVIEACNELRYCLHNGIEDSDDDNAERNIEDIGILDGIINKLRVNDDILKTCPKCGSPAIEPDWAEGYVICQSCNHSFEEECAILYERINTLSGSKWERI